MDKRIAHAVTFLLRCPGSSVPDISGDPHKRLIDSGAMYVHSPPSSVVADLVVVYNFRPAVDAGALVGLLMMPPPPGGRGGGGRRSKVEGGGKDEGENGEDAPPSATNRLPIAVGGWI